MDVRICAFEEDKQLQPLSFVVDNKFICSTNSLSLPIKSVALKSVSVLSTVRSFLLRHKKPNRRGSLRSKDTNIEGRVSYVELRS